MMLQIISMSICILRMVCNLKDNSVLRKQQARQKLLLIRKTLRFNIAELQMTRKALWIEVLPATWNWNLNTMFYYNKTLGGRHFINATLGMNAKETSSESEQMRFLGFGLGGINSPLFAAGQPDKTKVHFEKQIDWFSGAL